MAKVTKLIPFEAERHFETPEDIAFLLSDALATGEAPYIAKALGIAAKAHGITELARKTGLSRAALYAALSDEGNPTLDTVMKVLSVLGVGLHADVREPVAA